MTGRRDHEPPAAIRRWGWRYHHTGIPTDEPRAEERYLADYKMYVSGFADSPYGIEWMRFETDSPVHVLVRTLPHVAFEVDDIDAALEGKAVLTAPGSPSDGVRAAMIVDHGCPIELIQFTLLSFPSRAEWRAWLETHHATAGEARVAIDKKSPGTGSPTLSDIQEDALCFGWVDGTAAAVDGDRWAIRLTPRRPNSEWSMSNVRRVEELAARDLMTEAGWRAVEEAKRNGQWELAFRVEQTDIVPPKLETALRARPGLLEAYLSLSHSRRRQILRTLFNAKTDATLKRRIEAVFGELSTTGPTLAAP